MFGFVNVDYGSLSQEDKQIYQGFYCGLCRQLKEEYGFKGKLTLNFDMTFLAMFLTGFFCEKENRTLHFCALHPLKKRTAFSGKYIEYAAAMNILLTYNKLTDDINDENSFSARLCRRELNSAYEKAASKFKVKNQLIGNCLADLENAEKRDEHNPDTVSGIFGGLLGGLFDIDGNSEVLREFGFRLGKVIYIMDACVDFKRDIKKCRYNPMVEIPCENFQQILTVLLAECTRIYDKIDMIMYKSIIDNILYCGIWQKFREMNK